MLLAIVIHTAIVHTLQDGCPSALAIILDDSIIYITATATIFCYIIITKMHFMAILTEALYLSQHFLTDAASFLKTVICQEQYFHAFSFSMQNYIKILINQNIYVLLYPI